LLYQLSYIGLWVYSIGFAAIRQILPWGALHQVAEAAFPREQTFFDVPAKCDIATSTCQGPVVARSAPIDAQTTTVPIHN
jgi:hypothetical protein